MKGGKKNKRENVFLLIMSEELNYSGGKIKPQTAEHCSGDHNMHKKISYKPLFNVPTPPTHQSISPGCNFQETERFNVLWCKESPGFWQQRLPCQCVPLLYYINKQSHSALTMMWLSDLHVPVSPSCSNAGASPQFPLAEKVCYFEAK